MPTALFLDAGLPPVFELMSADEDGQEQKAPDDEPERDEGSSVIGIDFPACFGHYL